MAAFGSMIVALCGGLVWLGRLGSRVEELERRVGTLESGTWSKDTTDRIHGELRAKLEKDIEALPKAGARREAPPTPSGEFLEPTRDAVVESAIMASGTSVGKEPSRMLWIFVYSMDVSRYFPAARPADLQPNDAWSSHVQIGNAADAGRQFYLILTETDREGIAAIDAYLKSGSPVGLEGLPRGTREFARIRVRRAG